MKGPGLIEQIGDRHEEGDHQGQLDGRDEGVATSVAIMLVPAGNWLSSGWATVVDVVGEVDDDEHQQDGGMARSRRVLSSTRWLMRGCSA
jgi:hypothetical protein